MKQFLHCILFICLIPLYTLGQKTSNYSQVFPKERLLNLGMYRYGKTVASNGDLIVVGSKHGSLSQGIAYVYKLESYWKLLGKLSVEEEDPAVDMCKHIAMTEDAVVMGNGEEFVLFVKPSEGWTDMTDPIHLSSVKGLHFNGLKTTEDHIVLHFKDSGKDFLTGWKKVNGKWEEFSLHSNNTNFSAPFIKKDQIIDIENIDYAKKVNLYKATDNNVDLAFSYHFPQGVQDLKLKGDMLLVTPIYGDTLSLLKKNTEIWIEDIKPIKLYPENTEHYEITNYSSLNEDLISCRYLDPDGLTSVVCFECPKENWSSMNQTSIIDMNKELMLEEENGNLIHNKSALIVNSYFYPFFVQNALVTLIKRGDSWGDELSNHSLNVINDSIFGYRRELFGASIAKDGEYTAVLDMGTYKDDKHENVGRITIYKDIEGGGMEEVSCLKYNGNPSFIYKNLNFKNGVLVVSSSEVLNPVHSCILFEEGANGWKRPRGPFMMQRKWGEWSVAWHNQVDVQTDGRNLVVYEPIGDSIYYYNRNGGWYSKYEDQLIQFPHVEAERCIGLGFGIIAASDGTNISLYKIEDGRVNTDAFAKLKYDDQIPAGSIGRISKIEVSEHAIYAGLTFENEYDSDQKDKGRILIYVQQSNEWESHDAPESIIYAPEESNHCGTFGEDFAIAKDYLVSREGGSHPDNEKEGYSNVYRFKLDEDYVITETLKVDPGISNTLGLGYQLDIDNGKLVMGQPFNSEKGIFSGTVYGIDLELIGISGVEDFFAQGGLNIYPNPVQDQLHIELKDKQTAQISIYDLQGRLMDSFEMEGTSVTYNTSALPKGTYVLKVIAEETVNKVKVVK